MKEELIPVLNDRQQFCLDQLLSGQEVAGFVFHNVHEYIRDKSDDSDLNMLDHLDITAISGSGDYYAQLTECMNQRQEILERNLRAWVVEEVEPAFANNENIKGVFA
jgi:hypothetical protein